jgi:hypothetical protein
MAYVFRLRILLDFTAVALLVVCLAYWWQDNLVHELIGAALFALVIVHNVFNRRWYGTRKTTNGSRLLNTVVIISLALAMTIMLVTSLLISRDLFSFISLGGAFSVREIHMFVAYWTLLIVSLHLGTRWATVMNAAASFFRVGSASLLRRTALRGIAAAIALWGLKSTFDMGFGSKLMLTYTLDMWDFNEAAPQFFLNYVSIVGLYVALGHYVLSIARSRRSANQVA